MRGGGCGAHVVWATHPQLLLWGHISRETGAWWDMRADLLATHLHCAKSILRPGRGAHIYIRGGGAPHTGVNLRDNRPCEANRERLSLSQHSPPQRSLAPIVNGLSTDVKLLFLPPDFLFIIRWQQRVVSASIQQWQEFGMGLREMPSNPIQSDSILYPIQKY